MFNIQLSLLSSYLYLLVLCIFVGQPVHPVVSNHWRNTCDCEFTKLTFLLLFLYRSASTCIPDGYQKEISDVYPSFYTKIMNEIFCWRNHIHLNCSWIKKKSNPKHKRFIIWEGWKSPHAGLPALQLSTGIRFRLEIQSSGALCNCHLWLPHSFSNMRCGKFYTFIQQHCNILIYWCRSLFTR